MSIHGGNTRVVHQKIPCVPNVSWFKHCETSEAPSYIVSSTVHTRCNFLLDS